jgi:hypothetical protein
VTAKPGQQRQSDGSMRVTPMQKRTREKSTTDNTTLFLNFSATGKREQPGNVEGFKTGFFL